MNVAGPKIFQRRKGNVGAIPLILVVTFTLTISVLVGYKILDTVDDNTTDKMIDQEALDAGKQALRVFDVGIILVNASFYLASFIFVYRIRSNPVFALPAILFLAPAVWLSAELANVYSIIGSTEPLKPVANTFAQTTLFYQNLPIVTAVLGAVVVILLYGKTRSGQEVAV